MGYVDGLQKTVFALMLHPKDNHYFPATFIVVADGIAQRAKLHLHIMLVGSAGHWLMDSGPRGQAAYFGFGVSFDKPHESIHENTSSLVA